MPLQGFPENRSPAEKGAIPLRLCLSQGGEFTQPGEGT